MSTGQQTYLKPFPVVDALSEPFWAAAHEGRLVLQRCTICDRHQHYPRPHCVHCGRLELEWAAASGRAEVHTFTVTHRNDAPGFADELPYVFAILDLAEGVRMPGNIVDTDTDVDTDAVRIGMPVEVCFVRANNDLSIPQWRPAR